MRINRSLGAGRGRRRILTSLFASVLAVGATVLPASPAFAYTCKVNALLDPTAGQIQSLLDAGPSTVTFYGMCKGNFEVARAMTLVGASGATVDGDDGGSVFDVIGPFSGTAVFRGLKIVDGMDAIGGGLYITDATVVLDRVTVQENESTDVGGGVFVDAGSSLTITSSVFRNNAGEEGGAIFAYSPRLSITGSTFLGNVADDDGGAISYDTNDSGYDGNYGYDAAPAPVTISRSTFSGNVGGDEGGAVEIDSADVIISGSTFTRNYADYEGGALNIYDSEGVDPTATITASTFTSNSSRYDGGAILAYELRRLTVTGSRFTGNFVVYTGYSGGAIRSSATDTTISGSTFTSNRAGDQGGAVDLDGEWSDGHTITGSTFTGNEVVSGDGGALSLRWTETLITRSTFTRNVSGDDDEGGAITAHFCEDEDGGFLTVASSRFVSNVAQEDGGAIYTWDDCGGEAPVTITGSTFTGNRTEYQDGGAIFANDIDLVIRGSVFSGNSAGEDGGALSLEYGTLAVDKASSFTNNRAFVDGGALEYDGAFGDGPVLISGRFTGNVAGEDGGALEFDADCDDNYPLEISAATIERNVAQLRGGGIWLYGGSCGEVDVLVYDSIAAMMGNAYGTLDQGPVSISYNRVVDVLGVGGGIFISDSGTCCGPAVDDIVFATVDDDPGTIMIQRNSASDGGGIYLDDGMTYDYMYLDYGVMIAYNTYGGVTEPYCNAPWDATYVGNVGYDWTC